MEITLEQINPIAKKIKTLSTINFYIIILHFVSFILFFFLFIDLKNLALTIGFLLQGFIIIGLACITKYILDLKINKLFRQISDQYEDRPIAVFLLTGRQFTFKSIWLNWKGSNFYWMMFFSVHHIINSWRLNNFILQGAKKILQNK